MPFVASVCWEKKRWSESKFYTIGKLWYSPDDHHASLLLHGFRLGQHIAKPYANADAPYLKGDILCQTGEYSKAGSMVKDYLYCGWIYTDTNQDGVLYQIILEVNPLAMLLANAVNRKTDEEIKLGLFLSIHLEDKEERVKHEPTEAEQKQEYNQVLKDMGEDDGLEKLPF